MHTKYEGRPMSKLYKRKGVFYIRFKQNGQFRWLSLKTRDARKAASKRERIDRALSAEKLFTLGSRPIALTLTQLAEHYNTWAQGRRRPGTIYHIVLEINRFKELTGIEHVAAISRQHVDQFQRKLRASGAAPRTVNKALRSLRAAVNFAIDVELYDRKNLFSKFDALPVPKSIPRWLSAEEMHAALDQAEKHGRDAHLIFALGFYAGLRKEEIIAAR